MTEPKLDLDRNPTDDWLLSWKICFDSQSKNVAWLEEQKRVLEWGVKETNNEAKKGKSDD